MAARTCKRCNYSQESQLPVCLRCGAALAPVQNARRASEHSGSKAPQKRAPQAKSNKKVKTQRPGKQKPDTQKNPKKDDAKKIVKEALNLPSKQDLGVIALIISAILVLYFAVLLYDNGKSNSTTYTPREVTFVESVPSEDSTVELTVAEHNFCAAEERRLEEMGYRVETLRQVALYLYYDGAFETKCDSSRTVAWRLQEAKEYVRRESNRLVEEARKRVAGNPVTDRDHQIVEFIDQYVANGFIIVDAANVRSEPNTNSSRIGRLEALHEVLQLGPSEGGWVNILFFDQGDIKFGYMAERLVQTQSWEIARETYCELDRTQRPVSGHVFDRIGTGHNSLMVTASNSDTIVKLRDYRGDILTFFVRANETAWVADVPDGVFDVLFASGTKFSSKCVDFLGAMNVIGTRTPIQLRSRRIGQNIEYTEQQFDLRQQARGNFNPGSFTAEDFRQ